MLISGAARLQSRAVEQNNEAGARESGGGGGGGLLLLLLLRRESWSGDLGVGVGGLSTTVIECLGELLL